MKQVLICSIFLIVSIVGNAQATIEFNDTADVPVPIITFVEQTIDIGEVKLGDKRDLVFEFTNTGTDFLQIDLVTSCNCTSIDWPQGPIAPGASGKLEVTYDSTNQKLGAIKKTIDIICNTDPLVVEAFFNVNVIE